MNTGNHDLNPRQRAFCEHYAGCGNAAEAARRAGYSEKNARKVGHQLLTNADILQYIRQLQDEAAAPRIAGAKEAKATLSDIMRDSTQKASSRVKAAEILLRLAGEFLPDPKKHNPEDQNPEQDEAVLIYMPYCERDEGCSIRHEKM